MTYPNQMTDKELLNQYERLFKALLNSYSQEYEALFLSVKREVLRRMDK